MNESLDSLLITDVIRPAFTRFACTLAEIIIYFWTPAKIISMSGVLCCSIPQCTTEPGDQSEVFQIQGGAKSNR